jgi:hypothetical protein
VLSNEIICNVLLIIIYTFVSVPFIRAVDKQVQSYDTGRFGGKGERRIKLTTYLIWDVKLGNTLGQYQLINCISFHVSLY